MTLDELINQYGKRKAIFDTEKKALDKLGNEIKDIMRETESKYSTDSYTATFSVQHRTSMNEAEAINILKGTEFENEVIKTKLYVDTDALENLIYQGFIDSEIIRRLNACIEEKQVENLRITKKKGAK